jgi:hypothetical protein
MCVTVLSTSSVMHYDRCQEASGLSPTRWRHTYNLPTIGALTLERIRMLKGKERMFKLTFRTDLHSLPNLSKLDLRESSQNASDHSV